MSDNGAISGIPRSVAMKFAEQAPGLLGVLIIVLWGMKLLKESQTDSIAARKAQDEVVVERFRERDAQIDRFATIMDAAQTQMRAVIQDNTKVIIETNKTLGENNRALVDVARRLEKLN